jgi:hypothetical protein
MIQSEASQNVFEKEDHLSTTQSETKQSGSTNVSFVLSTGITSDMKSASSGNQQSSSSIFSATQSFVALPHNANVLPRVVTRSANIATRPIDNSGLAGESCNGAANMQQDKDNYQEFRSLKSTSSMNSFRSALSIQESDLEIAWKVKAVQSAMHAFETSIQILRSLIEKRISKTSTSLFTAANSLQAKLKEAKEEIDRRHVDYYKQHKEAYVSLFNAACESIYD